MVSYKEILKLSIPIMIGSAAQNLITLMDTAFLGRVGKVELGAIGMVGVYYLMITSIGYSFSKAGQIMIARRVGEGNMKTVGAITYSMWAFALFMALIFFLFVQFGSRWFFGTVIDIGNPQIYEACINYLDYRAAGLFFSYSGVIIMALYTGVARTKVIIYNAVAMGLVNMVMNYGLIFGAFGLPEMGISGAALASTISEIVAFSVFLIYMLLDKKARGYGLFEMPRVQLFPSKNQETEAAENTNIQPQQLSTDVLDAEAIREEKVDHKVESEVYIPDHPVIDLNIIKAQIKLSTPIILQSVVGIGSWFAFFIVVENMGTTELAISNLMRAVYLILMIPAWGFASGVNTIASNLIGKKKLEQVLPAITKTAGLCFVVTMVAAMALVFAPNFVLRVGTDDVELIEKAERLIWVLNVILATFSIAAIYFNGLIGTGATKESLWLQMFCVVLYLFYIYFVIKTLQVQPQLEWAWLAEFWYWGVTWALSYWYLKSNKWHAIKV